LPRGEAASQASKAERQYVSGRKIDLMLLTQVTNDKDALKDLELCSLEIKPADVSTGTVQRDSSLINFDTHKKTQPMMFVSGFQGLMAQLITLCHQPLSKRISNQSKTMTFF
jgi:hypothetical protein